MMRTERSRSGGGQGQPEFMNMYPNPGNRIQRIEEAIAAEFPNGTPAELIR